MSRRANFVGLVVQTKGAFADAKVYFLYQEHFLEIFGHAQCTDSRAVWRDVDIIISTDEMGVYS